MADYLEENPVNLFFTAGDIAREERNSILNKLLSILPKDKKFLVRKIRIKYRNGFAIEDSLEKIEKKEFRYEITE
ncbi:hypothetical protein [Frigoriflavimonas asaccharolytica]|uniref:Uncharacterized protein n=1 Tax=Frigoriflavimonas asaccharolytica TaxID=2735899 RepID=A0A8J8K484_9FLAO|nr:hypothetical protein [Frigoriflavimonas asaccharolytica]NRS91425.1 hypothetical protein [Frigoriflavimonas asaccharolytica]